MDEKQITNNYWKNVYDEQTETSRKLVERLYELELETLRSWQKKGFLLQPNVLLLSKQDFSNYIIYLHREATAGNIASQYQRPGQYHQHLFKNCIVVEADVEKPTFLFRPAKDSGAL